MGFMGSFSGIGHHHHHKLICNEQDFIIFGKTLYNPSPLSFHFSKPPAASHSTVRGSLPWYPHLSQNRPHSHLNLSSLQVSPQSNCFQLHSWSNQWGNKLASLWPIPSNLKCSSLCAKHSLCAQVFHISSWESSLGHIGKGLIFGTKMRHQGRPFLF